MAQKFFCLLDAPAQHVLVRAFAGALFERSGEVVEVQARDFCQHAEFKVLAKVLVDVVVHAIEARRREPSAIYVEFCRGGRVSLGEVCGESGCDGFGEERAAGGFVDDIRSQRLHQATDLRIVQVQPSGQLHSSAFRDLSDAPCEEG